MSEIPIDEEILEDLYTWVDQVPLSRPKKDIKRDFADGVQVAEIIKFYLPKSVDVHNYPAAHKLDSKLTNWHTLNRKVFRKLGFEIGDDVIRNISTCKPWAVEQFLMLLRRKIDQNVYESQRNPQPVVSDPRTEADRAYNKGGRNSNQGHLSPVKTGGGGLTNTRKAGSLQNLNVGTGVIHQQSPVKGRGGLGNQGSGSMVPKIVVEEKEQEVLAKDETIQILQAKIRRLEHLLHLKDIRIDDLQAQMETLNTKLRPTANYKR